LPHTAGARTFLAAGAAGSPPKEGSEKEGREKEKSGGEERASFGSLIALAELE
jgi:hypothetical protein